MAFRPLCAVDPAHLRRSQLRNTKDVISKLVSISKQVKEPGHTETIVEEALKLGGHRASGVVVQALQQRKSKVEKGGAKKKRTHANADSLADTFEGLGDGLSEVTKKAL